jgi:hypothetical protein
VRTGNSDISAANPTAKVLCVVKIVGTNMKCVKFHDSNLAITPWHPMLVTKAGKTEAEWVFPAEYAAELGEKFATKVDTPVVYNFLLESSAEVDTSSATSVYSKLLERTAALKDHTMVINGVPCVTFGHGLETNKVVKHEFWGNMRAILRDMHVMQGWFDGQVLLKSETACVKDPSTNLVVKLVQTPLVDQYANVDWKTTSSETTSSKGFGLSDGDRVETSESCILRAAQSTLAYEAHIGCSESIRG